MQNLSSKFVGRAYSGGTIHFQDRLTGRLYALSPCNEGYLWHIDGVVVDWHVRTRAEIISLIQLDSVPSQVKLAA
jgi:hypothetical protein